MLSTRVRFAVVLSTAIATAGLMAPLRAVAVDPPPGDDTPTLLTPKGEHEDGSDEAGFDKLRDAYYWSRLLSGDDQLTINEAAALRTKAAQQAGHDRDGRARRRRPAAAPGPARARTRSCRSGGRPTPSRRCRDASGRSRSATTARSSSAPPRAASGRTTRSDRHAGPRAPTTPTPSRSARWRSPRATTTIVYMGSGEGALSGDSYYGDGFYRSTDGGVTWQHVSTLFTGQAVSAIAVDPTNATARVRRHGARPRRCPPHHQPDRGRTASTSRPTAARRGRCARAPPTSCTARPTS